VFAKIAAENVKSAAARDEPPPPAFTAEDVIAMKDQPGQPIPPALQSALDDLKAIQAETLEPAFNDAGDEVVYTLDQPSVAMPGRPNVFYFHKENGQWYAGSK
jgi:hypothetical protein